MYLVRFMSNEEKEAFFNGEELVNWEPHPEYYTDSEGFCFMKVNTSNIDSESEILSEVKRSYEYLDGIVSNETGLVLEADVSLLTESTGRYADPYSSNSIWVTEYCCNEYDSYDFTPHYEITKVDDEDMQIRRI